MKSILLLCMIIICNAQEIDYAADNNFLTVLPAEIVCMVFNNIPNNNLNKFCDLMQLRLVDTSCNSIVEPTLHKRWEHLMKTLFNNSRY